MYSSIKKRRCKCGCNRYPTLGANGYYIACAPVEIKEKIITGQDKQRQQKYENQKVRALMSEQDPEEVRRSLALRKYYDDAAIEIARNPHCRNCGELIHPTYYRAATAHALPKRKEYGFPSVAVHPLNRIFLGAGCGCHDTYDHSWQDASQMKIWPDAVEIFIELYPLIDPSEHKNIPYVLRIYIP